MSPVNTVALGPAHYLLALAILVVWLPSVRVMDRRWPLWPVVFALALVVGVIQQVLTPLAAGMLILVAGLLWCGRRPMEVSAAPAEARFAGIVFFDSVRRTLFLIGVALALAVALHRVPGFARGLVIPETRLTPDAAVYFQYLNFDKGAVGLLLLALACQRMKLAAQWADRLRVACVIAGVTLAVAIPGALLADYVRYAPKFPNFAWTFLFVNLFFTCVAEEAFFRGVVQEAVHRSCERSAWCSGAPQRRWIPIAVVLLLALPFGVAHTPSSVAAFLFIFVASVSYGYAYLKTRTIEASILVHFCVNAVHFLLFTYPYRSP
jgi:uncharacterized protein